MKTIVVLGAGLAATPIIHNLMKEVVNKSSDYKLVLVAPNTHYHYPIAMPRVIVPGVMSADKVLVDLRPGFKDFSAEKFEFLEGKASGLDPSGNTVTVALNDGGSRTVEYSTLVVATGASTKDGMPWKTLANTEETAEKIRQVQGEIEKAKVIVVAGGGVTGTEAAGELGCEYSAKGAKEVHFVYNEALPLYSDVIDGARKAAESELRKMKVKLHASTSVGKVGRKDGGGYEIELKAKDGSSTTLAADAYVPAFGLTPNAAFAPAGLLDERGYLKQSRTLQHPAHANIFVLGDVGNLEPSKAMIADAQTKHLVKNLPAHLLSGAAVPAYEPSAKSMYGITLGRNKATGQMGTFKLPSIMIWFVKGRTLFTEKVPALALGQA